MITKEVLFIINHKNKDDAAKLLQNLYNEFRTGRNLQDILILLNSDIATMRYYACDILNEIFVNDKILHEIIVHRLNEILLNDTSDITRIRAYDALYGMYLENQDIIGLSLMCEKMKNDQEKMIKNGSRNFLEKLKNAPSSINFDAFLQYLYS